MVLRNLTQLYRELDLNDLSYLEFKHKNHKYETTALRLARDYKDNDVEIIKQKSEYRYMGSGIVYNILDGEVSIND